MTSARAAAFECALSGGSSSWLYAEAGHGEQEPCWVHDHFQRLGVVQPILRVLGRPLQVEADFLS